MAVPVVPSPNPNGRFVRAVAWCMVDAHAEMTDGELERKTSSGNFMLECALGQRLVQGGKLAEALVHYLVAARAGVSPAMHNAGVMLEKGIGTDRDIVEALRWYRRADAKGQMESAHRLGVNLALKGDDGCGGLEEGVAFIDRAARAGLTEAKVDLGMMHMYAIGVEKPNPKTGLRWLARASKDGSATASYELAVMYTGRSEVEPNAALKPDMRLCVKYAMAAADQGHALAQDLLGQFNLSGYGMPVDLAKARDYFSKASAKGIISSKRDLAIMLDNGDGGDKDETRAIGLYEEAAADEDVVALFRLGLACQDGRKGLAADPTRAVDLLMKAAAKSCIPAISHLIGSGMVSDHDQVVLYKLTLVNTARDASHPEQRIARDALSGLGLIKVCGACRRSKWDTGSALFECGRCRSVQYCSKPCQKIHWRLHKPNCKQDDTAADSSPPESEEPTENGDVAAAAAEDEPTVEQGEGEAEAEAEEDAEKV